MDSTGIVVHAMLLMEPNISTCEQHRSEGAACTDSVLPVLCPNPNNMPRVAVENLKHDDLSHHAVPNDLIGLPQSVHRLRRYTCWHNSLLTGEYVSHPTGIVARC